VISTDFDRLLSEVHSQQKMVLGVKAGEYSRDDDRLLNFKTAGAFERCTPERALWGMAAKHFVSLTDLVNDLDAGTDTPMPLWEEKLGDARNYLVLLEGLLRERYPKTGKRERLLEL
jgi:hypothetical protein